MASSYFLKQQFEEVLVYLNSIKSYFHNDDTFNFNMGQACVASGDYKEGEAALTLIKDPVIRKEQAYIMSLTRAYVMNKKANLAWDLYTKMKQSSESFAVLRLIANDCYQAGEFYYAAKAFDAMERLDPNPDYWEGKRGASIGVFQLVIAKKLPKSYLSDVVNLLQKSNHSQDTQVVTLIKKWLSEN